MTEIKIGILLPRSTIYPALGYNILNGINSCLKSLQEHPYKLVYENIGFGGDEAEIYSKTEKLLLQEDVFVVIAFMDHTSATKLDTLFSRLKKFLVVLDTGAHLPLVWTPSPFRYTISLHAALATYLTGQHAAKKGFKNTFFATSFYEGGYLQCYSYIKGHEKGGGNILYNSIIPFRLEDYQTNELEQAYKELSPDAILALFSAESGELFIKKIQESRLLQNKLNLFVSPFMLEESWLSNLEYPFDGINGYVSWLKKIPSKDNKKFLEQVLKDHQEKPTIFTLLGWEGALLTNVLYQAYLMNNKNLLKTSEDLKDILLESPRGMLKLHQPSNIFYGPMYLAEVVKNNLNQFCSLNLKEELAYEEQELFINHTPEGIFSKWTNTYLCI